MELALRTPVDAPIVNGRYRLGRVLGAGGMGTVHEAEHLALGERVALKLLRPDYAAMPELCERFLREAKSLFRIHHENVVRVLDVDTWTPPGGGQPVPYIVMDFVEGVSVDRLLAKRGRLAYGEAVEIVRQTCEGLGEAHDLGIVHRDVKPHNVMVTSRGDGTATVKLLDFGIAQMSPSASQAISTRLTVTEAVIGTPSYMSPEQLRSARAADARSDVWSCGVVLFELLTGHLPWNAASPGDLAVRMYMEPLAARPHPFPADVPAEVAAIVLRCLATEPEARWADAAELADALAPFATVVSDAEIATAGSMRVRANRRTPNPRPVRAPSRPEMTFARQKVHGEDGRTAFERHQLVPRQRGGEASERRDHDVETGSRGVHAAPTSPLAQLQQLSFASLVAMVAGAVGFLVLLLGVLLVVIATRSDGNADAAKAAASASSTIPSARAASAPAPVSSQVVAPKVAAPKEPAPVASTAHETTTAEKAKLAAPAPTTSSSSATAGERRAPKGSSTASFFTDKW